MVSINWSIGYFLGINLLAFLVCGIDKYKAKNNWWRISENYLLFTAILGGSIGFLIGMKLFSHKTRHLKFTIGVPLILLIQLGIGYALYQYGALGWLYKF